MRGRVKVVEVLLSILKTLQLALPKIGVGWMFALLTIDFNRVAVVELGITAILVTAMLSLHYFLSPFQVLSGRLADRHPIAGLRRTPYLVVGSIVASLIFVALPSVAQAMSGGALSAYLIGFGLLALFGIAIAIIGDSHHALIAEVTTPRARGGVISVVWIVTILSTIFAAVVMNQVRPTYSPEAMQRLYNLTPFIVIISTLLGVIGVEKRLKGTALHESLAAARVAAPAGNPFGVAARVLRENRQARYFFAFLLISILAIFLQDNILEVFGAEVFALPVEETTRFQPAWGGGVLLGMLLMGILSVVFTISKRTIALIGCVGTAAGMLLLALAAALQLQDIVRPALMLMGLFTGFFNVGALSMMMDMTVEGATGLYMGIWGVAQAVGNGIASFGGGALHTALIESKLMTPPAAYFAIFSLEAVGMIAAAVILTRLSVQHFHQQPQANTLTHSDALRAMEAGAV